LSCPSEPARSRWRRASYERQTIASARVQGDAKHGAAPSGGEAAVRHDAVTWLDFRADDLARARDFIRSLQEEGVIDELGFLALLGRFSDLLHPATTTLMRSARYFCFIAGIYRSLEREGVRASQIPHLSRQRQDELRDVLSDTETVGVIGRDAGINLRQFPSQIYWSGLKKLGMFTSNLSESAYQEQFDDIRRSRRGYQDDDKTPQGPEGVRFWSDDLPPASFLDSDGRIRPGATFKLTRAEASDLHKRFTSRFSESLLSHMLKHRLIGIDWPWECPKLPESLAVWVWHARNMSLLVRGATLQYYSLLMEERDKLRIEEDTDLVAPIFNDWWIAAKEPLKKWRTSEFVTVPTVASALRLGNRGDRWFIDGWLERCVAASTAEALLRDEKARHLIRERERRVKPAKARLKYEKHLRQWKPDRVGEGIYQFDYRHSIGSRFVSEILDGMERGQ